MGTINHNAIIATTWNKSVAKKMQQWCVMMGHIHTSSTDKINGYTTLFFPPDGSKEGWNESDFGDEVRAHIITRLKEDDYDDGSSPWAWIEVGYGDYGQAVLNGNCKNVFSEQPYQET